MELDYQCMVPRRISGEELPLRRPTVVAIGNFDGVHIGHQALLKRLVEEAKALDALPVVFTFTQNPKVLFFGAKYLCGETQKLELFRDLGVEAVYFASYGDLHDYSPEAFVREFLIEKLHCVRAVVGSDFRFGKGRTGDHDTICRLMEENGQSALVVPPVCMDGKEVSSTDIRRYLQNGDLPAVEKLLGRPYSIILPVREGRRLGRTIGFPTINMLPSADRQLPRFGVYASEVCFGGKVYRGITNVGIKPTVSSESRPVYETHLFDYDCEGELYGTTVKLTLKRFIRKERCFVSLEQLREQIASDVAALEGSAGKEEV